MLSSEISDLERFIDSYVAPSEKSSNSPANWSRTQSFEEGYSGSLNATPHGENIPVAAQSNTGTEIWGQKPLGNEWNASARPLQEWNEYRPRIQERATQWQQNLQQQEEQHYQMQWGMQPPNQQYNSYPISQDPSQIQAVVSGFIRQNNINRPPANLPPWVDVSRPPPPIPQAPNQPPMGYNPSDGYVYYEEPVDPRLMRQEPILQSMTFQRSNPTPNPQFMMGANTEIPPQVSHPQNEVYGRPEATYSPPVHYNPQPTEPPQQYYTPPPQNYPASEEHIPDFHAAIMQGGHFESPDGERAMIPPNYKEPPSNVAEHLSRFKEKLEKPTEPSPVPTTNSALTFKQVAEQPQTPAAASAQPPTQDDHATQNKAKNVQEKYPNSRLRSQHNSLEDDAEKKLKGNVNAKQSSGSYQRQESEDVFENETESKRKNQSNRKHSFHRRISAADEDMDWRKRDNSDEVQSKPNGRYNRRSSSDNEYRMPRSQDHARKGSRETRDSTNSFESKDTKTSNPQTRKMHSPKEKTAEANTAEPEVQRHVTQKSKKSVLSWLENTEAHTGDLKEIRLLKISDSEADLTKFIEMTQIYATTEAKMREVAEIICNKALKDTKFGRNASILCDRMSFMMVHGTKFRTVVLNVMQGHYKNRDQIFAASFRKDRRWFGFVTFLIEIFINVRTFTRERLVVLITPVCNSLFQVLTGEKVDKEHIECFGQLFSRVGPALESEDLKRMNELMSEIRDRCVMSKSPFVKRVLLHCVQLYSSKWK